MTSKNTWVILFSLILSYSVWARNGQDRGGGDTYLITEANLRNVLQSGHLKTAMIHYLRMIQVAQIEDQNILSTLSRITPKKLLLDIEGSPYEISDSGCQDSKGSDVSASTEIGRQGGAICFDIKTITSELRGYSFEPALIQLASLAFHEHIHHFQNRELDLVVNEAEAYNFAAYVISTAQTTQVPLLSWIPNLAANKHQVEYDCRRNKWTSMAYYKFEFNPLKLNAYQLTQVLDFARLMVVRDKDLRIVQHNGQTAMLVSYRFNMPLWWDYVFIMKEDARRRIDQIVAIAPNEITVTCNF